MANGNKRKADARRAAIDRTSVRVISAGRDEQKHKKQQDRLARQEQKMAEKLERQKQAPVKKQTPAAPPAPKPAEPSKNAPAKKPSVVQKETFHKVKDGFRVLVGGRKRKLARIAGLTALIVAAVIVVNSIVPIGIWEYVQNILAGTGTGDGFPVAVSSSKDTQILSVGSDIALLDDSSLLLYKSNGKQLFSRQHGYSSPAMCGCSARILVYDRGGKQLRMENRAKTLFSLETGGEITTADMADNGTFAVVTRGVNYISDVTAYNASGKEQFVWHSATRQVTAVSLSDNGRYMAVATLHVEGGKAVTTLLLFDTRRGTTLFEEVCQGSIPLSLSCKGTTTLAILDNVALSITKTGKRTDLSYDGGTLVCYDTRVSYGAVLVLGMYQDTHNNRMLMVDKNLKLLGEGEITTQPIAVSAKASDVAVLTDQQVLFYNRKGVLRQEAALQSDARNLLCKGSRAILLGADRLEEIKK